MNELEKVYEDYKKKFGKEPSFGDMDYILNLDIQLILLKYCLAKGKPLEKLTEDEIFSLFKNI